MTEIKNKIELVDLGDPKNLLWYENFYRRHPRHVLETLQKGFQNDIREEDPIYMGQAVKLLPIVNKILKEMEKDRKAFGPTTN